MKTFIGKLKELVGSSRLVRLVCGNAYDATNDRIESGEKVFIDADQAGRNLRHFLNKLNVKTYGNAFKRHNKRLEVIPTYEYADGKHLHYHLIIKKLQPYGSTL